MNDNITRVVRYLLRLARILKEESDKRDYQMELVYSILENQNREIKDLRAGIAQLAEQGFCKPQVAGSNPVPGSGSIKCEPNIWQSGCAPRPKGDLPKYYTPDPDMVPRHYFTGDVCHYCGHSKGFLQGYKISICHGVKKDHDGTCMHNGADYPTAWGTLVG